MQPAKTFPELRRRLRNYDVSMKARCGARTGHGHIALQAVGRKKEVSSSGCYVCGQKGHMVRDCQPKSDSGNPVLEAVGASEGARVLQVWATWTFCRVVPAREDRVLQLLCCNLMTSLWIRDALIIWCRSGLSFLALRAGTKGQLLRAPTARCQRLRAKDQCKCRSGSAMIL